MKSSRGQSTIEFALILPLFALVFFAFVEFGHLFYVQVTLQHALSEAGRYMVTGRTEKNADDEDMPRPDVIKDVFCKNLIGTGLSCDDLGAFAMVPADGGGADDIVTVTATFEKPLFTALIGQFFTDGKANFSVSTSWKNEP
ncbi:MAG: TadE/TadG family type IV pilus assembly protein, partial [Candidatus Binatia bacterium]